MQSPGFEDQKQAFRIILANRNTCFYQMTQPLMSTDSKSSFASSLCLSLRVPQHNSLSLICAHDILLVTILTLPISKSSLLSRVHLHLVAAKRGANLFFINYNQLQNQLHLRIQARCCHYPMSFQINYICNNITNYNQYITSKEKLYTN